MTNSAPANRSSEELEIRAAVETWGRAKWPGSRVVHELVTGSCRIDMAFIQSDHIAGVEIKSSRDRLARLDGNNGATRSKIVEDAKVELAGGGGKLWEQYLGAKNYDGFGDQREDHRYGYGPRHGSIVFSVGLAPEVRARGVAFLQSEEIEDALYLLAALPTIEAALREECAA